MHPAPDPKPDQLNRLCHTDSNAFRISRRPTAPAPARRLSLAHHEHSCSARIIHSSSRLVCAPVWCWSVGLAAAQRVRLPNITYNEAGEQHTTYTPTVRAGEALFTATPSRSAQGNKWEARSAPAEIRREQQRFARLRTHERAAECFQIRGSACACTCWTRGHGWFQLRATTATQFICASRSEWKQSDGAACVVVAAVGACSRVLRES